jgi:predicted amidohydrolase YtcJ
VARLDREGFLIHIHALGDGAVRAALDAFALAAQANGPRDRRHQIAHIGVVDPADVPRFAALGVTANFTPRWFAADDPASGPTESALGPERSRWIMPVASIAAHNGRITAGSDWPSTPMSPLAGIQWAITHRPLDGHLPTRLRDQRLALASALAAYTRDAAWAMRADALAGTIAVGKSADLAVLDGDPFKIPPAQYRRIRVLLTLVGGKPVYRDPGFAWR